MVVRKAEGILGVWDLRTRIFQPHSASRLANHTGSQAPAPHLLSNIMDASARFRGYGGTADEQPRYRFISKVTSSYSLS